MFRSIIVPLDGSSFGDYALPYGIALARKIGAELKLVHVHRPYLPGEKLEALPAYQLQRIAAYDTTADDNARRRERARLWELADRLAAEGVPATAHILSGRVPDAIAGFARDAGGGLIVMSTHGVSGFQRIWLGSVADAVVRHSSTPVLLVRPQADLPPDPEDIQLRSILVPVDGSRFASAVVGSVASLAGQERLQVTFFEATPTSGAGEEDDALFDWIRGKLPPNLRPAEFKKVVDRQPAHAILAEATSGAYDLIAMATHGLGGAHHLLVGSTADKVMRGTDKPILLFRPQGLPAAVEVETAIVVEEMVVEEVIAIG